MSNTTDKWLDGILMLFETTILATRADSYHRAYARNDTYKQIADHYKDLENNARIDELTKVCGNKDTMMTVIEYGNAMTLSKRIEQLQSKKEKL